MKKPSQTFRPHRFKRTIILLTSVSSIALVAGCGASIKNPFGSGRPEQIVDGARRMPMLNQGDMKRTAAQAPPPQILVPSQTPALPPSSKDNFDYYAAAANGIPQQDPASSRMLGSLNPAPVKAEGAAPPRVRKQLPGNIRQGALNQAPAPVMAAAPPDYTSAPSQPFDASVAEPVAEKTAVPAESPSFFERVFGSAKRAPEGSLPPWKAREVHDRDEVPADRDASVEAAAAPVEAAQEQYPALSSVPQVPAQFQDVQANRQQDMRDLEASHARTLQEKQALGGEPSQQQNVTPVEMPQPVPQEAQAQPAQGQELLGHAAAPVDAPVDAPMNAPVAEDVSPDAPRAPRRGIDIMTQEEWEALQKAREQQQQAPISSLPEEQNPQVQQSGAQPVQPPLEVEQSPSGQNITPAPAQEAPQRQPYFWEGWGRSQNAPPQPAEQPAPDQAPNQVGIEPQSALPLAEEPVASEATQDGQRSGGETADTHAAAEPSPASDTQVLAVQEVEVAAQAEPPAEVADARPSFFSRLFGESPRQAETDNAPAAPAGNAEAADEQALPVKETAAVSDEQPEWVRDWLTRPTENAAPPETAMAQRDLATPPQVQAAVRASPVAPEQQPAAGNAEDVTPPEAAAESETASDNSNPESPSSSRDWLQSLVSGKPADNEKPKEPETRTEAVAEALPEPVQEPVESAAATDDGAEPQLIGQMSDKAMLKLVDEPSESESTDKVAADAPLSPPLEPEALAQATATETPAAKESDSRPSFFSRLFKKSEPEAVTEAAPEAVAEIETAPEPRPVAEPEKPVMAETPAPAEETQIASEPEAPRPAAEGETRPSFFSRLFKKSEPDAVPEAVTEAAPEAVAEAAEPEALPEPAAEPEKPVMAEAPAPAEETQIATQPAAERPSFFARMFGKKADEEKAEVVPEMAEERIQPASMISAAAPVMQVTTGDEQPESNAGLAASAPASLPSPQILKEIKMMPASRYSARRKAQQSQSAEY